MYKFLLCFRCACLVGLAQANRARHSRQELGQSVPAFEANSALETVEIERKFSGGGPARFSQPPCRPTHPEG